MVAPNAELVELSNGHGFVEGPAVNREGTLFFTDLGNGTINALRDGALSVFRSSRADAANGLFFDESGRLHACEGGSGRVTRTELDGRVSVLAESFEGVRFNAPNDLVVARDGSVYFTDPYFGSASTQPQPVRGVYRIAPDGAVVRVVDYLDRPNGIALSPDQSTLYVTNDNPAGVGEIHAWDIAADGMLSNGRIFATAAVVMDGMVVDANGTFTQRALRRGETAAAAACGSLPEMGKRWDSFPLPNSRPTARWPTARFI